MSTFLLDTHLLIWALADELTPQTADLIGGGEHEILFSPVNIWEIAIKAARYPEDFPVDADEIARMAVASGMRELPVISAATARVQNLPMHHADPFDRLLVAQAIEASVFLLTSDRLLPPYSLLVRFIRRARV